VGGSGMGVGVPPPEHAATSAINITIVGPRSERRPIFMWQQPFQQQKSRQVYNDVWRLGQ
jgi:hypothetical protein